MILNTNPTRMYMYVTCDDVSFGDEGCGTIDPDKSVWIFSSNGSHKRKRTSPRIASTQNNTLTIVATNQRKNYLRFVFTHMADFNWLFSPAFLLNCIAMKFIPQFSYYKKDILYNITLRC